MLEGWLHHFTQDWANGFSISCESSVCESNKGSNCASSLLHLQGSHFLLKRDSKPGVVFKVQTWVTNQPVAKMRQLVHRLTQPLYQKVWQQKHSSKPILGDYMGKCIKYGIHISCLPSCRKECVCYYSLNLNIWQVQLNCHTFLLVGWKTSYILLRWVLRRLIPGNPLDQLCPSLPLKYTSGEIHHPFCWSFGGKSV